ncbi:DUF1311 domain-containing protein [Mesorhizobium sp. CGMCC 1.15528]|uniref:DUF1311 domain-containing protein n=1 Tax=Mesorhizobium zhangyense TaxID=1776730 RepID=A0A7C9VGN3_9HYPH|nr:lysozyme inhibitor LprI family protein [Mesorhizobium zhangyense]NGN44071.1 DUF1311 domain-containing protein [Mesorhizobium zhangyense]
MKLLVPLALLTAASVASPAFADDVYDKCMKASDGTNASWGQCGGAWMDRADKALNTAWKELHGAVDGDTATALLDEQRAWNDFKEKSCQFYANGEYGREGQVLSYPTCRAEVIEARTADLKAYLTDVKGDN